MDKLKTDVGLVQDIRGLDQLRQMSHKDQTSQQQALEAAARQFESIFNQMWVGSMRQANESLAPESPLNSRYSQFYQGMLDEQMTSGMASPGGSSSLSKLIVKQFSKQSAASDADATQPRQLKMPEDRVPVMHRFARWEDPRSSQPAETGANIAKTKNDQNLTSANAERTVANGVAAAERFVARLAKMESNFQRPAATGAGNGAFSSPQEFVRQLLPAARQVAKQIGLSPVALLAQAALETGWGKHMLPSADGSSSRNLFGVKAGSQWQGASHQVSSLEYENGQPVMRKSAFRNYDNFSQSMQDYVNLIGTHERYGKAREVAHDPEAYFDALQQAGYATDPHYAKKLKQILHSDALKDLWQST
jgi:peptidoglycan hydrolase FlgJ